MKQAILFSRIFSTQDSLYWHSCPKYSTKALIGSRMCPYNLRQTILPLPHFSFCRGFLGFWDLGMGELENQLVCDVWFLEYYNVE